VIDHIKDMPVFSNHVPTSFSKIPRVVKLVKRKVNPHKAMEEQSFRLYKSALSTLEIFAPEFYAPDEQRRKRNIARVEKKNEKKNGKKNIVSGRKTQIEKISGYLVSNKNTKIAVFLSLLDVNRLYIKSDLLDLLRQANYEQPQSMFSSLTSIQGSGWGCGCIFDQKDNRWCVKSSLNVAWSI